jgi:hypothetical protein
MDIMITFVKRLQLSRLLVMFLAGIILLVSTACSQSPSDELSKTETPGYVNKDNVVLKAVKDSYKTVPSEGGMNNHRDVDRRQNTKFTDAKAQNLINRANNHLQNGTRNPVEAVENLKSDAPINKIKDKFEDVSKNILDSTHEAKEGANRGFENLKTNIKSTSDSVADKVEQVIQ